MGDENDYKSPRYGQIICCRRLGYCLSRPADLISIADLIRMVDGPLALASCASRTAYSPCEDCPTPDDCSLRAILLDARDAMARVLESYTLARPFVGLKRAAGL